MATRAVELEAARRSFLAGTARAPGPELLAPSVAASWERSRSHDVDPERVTAHFLGHQRDVPRLVTCAGDVLDAFTAEHPGAGCSVVLLDPAGVVRARRDCDRALARLLDEVLLVPGYGYGERAVGTTAAAVALHDRADTAVDGAEHFHSRLTCLAGAAAVVTDPHTGGTAGVLSVLCHQTDRTPLALPLARTLADRVTEAVAGEPHRVTRAILDRFAAEHAGGGAWVLATDGDYVVTNGPARQLPAADQRVLSDLLLASLVLADFTTRHVDLPSGRCAEVGVRPVHLGGASVGCVLTGAPAGEPAVARPPESVRRQGSHVAPTTRRDYAQDLRVTRHEHAQARIRANRELLSPYLRARQEVVASIRQGRNHLLIGEPGVGKRTLLVEQFRAAYPAGRVVTVDGETYAGDAGPDLAPDGRPTLVLLAAMNLLTPVGARRLDEALRPLVALAEAPLVVGCVDTPAVDATRPYGLLLRHFHEVTRVPALRYRADEIGEIALAVLRRLSGRRSLRLSLQVVRVLEGYAWPGNVSELEDVLRYVVARKPVGEIQARDLPQLCFQGRSRRMSMLEAAQCDAVIQALYECNGNRYKAAAMLGIARSSLYRKIDAFGISYIA
ncbi:helix-turn-helix domain-containing protein [Pseudonocardia hydrocarbonoxydans]|uniref:Siderophore-interacting protein n=1 Tax=Pseudonocardia hydrocarbonoxydans TaxID=76726 RepID=A0A4Y3WS84_9PSEU|nr:helix-turn-helix domain-containing protein [Pseudonocardia hydrocarbonoxydans]GEC21715.1 siderophore-interacting protein [Pseudonocardia hydrocarbonoxydans]